MARKVLIAEVGGGRVRGRSRLGWMDGVKATLGGGGVTVETARRRLRDGTRPESVESPGTYVTL